LSTLTVNGTAAINGGSIYANNQDFEGAVTLGADTTIAGSAGTGAATVKFAGAVDSKGSARSLTVNVQAGTTVLNGTVNAANVSIGGGNAVFDGNIGSGLALNSFKVNPIGGVGADNIDVAHGVTTTGNQTYTAGVTLTGNSTFTSSGGVVDFGSTVLGDSVHGGESLTVNAKGLTLNGLVGSSTVVGRPGSLSTVVVNVSQAPKPGGIDINVTPGIVVRTTGNQTYSPGGSSPSPYFQNGNILLSDQGGFLVAYNDAGAVDLESVIKAVFTTLATHPAETGPGIQGEVSGESIVPPGAHLKRSGEVKVK
jgi:hypothetical protein